jgi:sporulation protein YlmC with PRC-barrel domain
MLVPFGTHVRDKDGKSIGTVSRLVLHPESRQVAALVVRQGVLDRREIVVPIRMVERAGDEVRLMLRAAELDGLDLFGAPALRPMPDQWPMPMGFDLRSFFLVAGDGWTEATLPFVLTSPTVSGTPAFIPDPDAPERVKEPAIAADTPVYDNAGRRVGEVKGVELESASGRITRVVVRGGVLFRSETPIPAGLVASVGDRITLSVSADEVKKLEPGSVAESRTAPAR